MNIEEIKMDHFENFEELIKTCKMWIRDDDIDAYYRFFEFNCMKALATAYEKEKEKNKDMSCDLTETRADNIDESTMLKQIKLKLQEKNIPIETLLAEFERLEDLEDDLTTVYLNGVYDGEKKVKDKIKAKIEELEKEKDEYEDTPEWELFDYLEGQIEVLHSLLKE